jgi:hypothetical protein
VIIAVSIVLAEVTKAKSGVVVVLNCSVPGLRELLDGLKGLFDRLGDLINRSLLTQLCDLNVVREFRKFGLHC